MSYPKMLFSFHEGWDEVRRTHPRLLKTFLLLTLPFSLLPPAMQLYAGHNHPEVLLTQASPARWEIVALTFFIAELISVPLIAWAIKAIARSKQLSAQFHDTYLLAAISAIPMWLSSLALAIPYLTAMLVLALFGLLGAASLLYHGTYTILNMQEEVDAFDLSVSAFSLGAIVWVLLVALVVMPLMG